MTDVKAADKNNVSEIGIAERGEVENNSTHPLIQLNLHDILRSRIRGWKGRLIPGFLISRLEKIICQEELNELLRKAYPERGSRFSSKILECLNIKVKTIGIENIPKDEPVIFASNHPLGGLDGIALVSVLGKLFGDDNLGVLVNDMLLNVEPLKDLFLPVNKYGAQGRHAARILNEALASGKQLVMFPAGLVSRLNDDGEIADLEWHKSFVTKSIENKRCIIPVRFEALNSPRFYKFAHRRLKSGLKINIEQALLPSEIFRSEGKEFKIIFGKPVDAIKLKESGVSVAEITKICRKTSDELGTLLRN